MRALPLVLLHFTLLIGSSLGLGPEWGSSERAPSPHSPPSLSSPPSPPSPQLDAAELVRDAPLYPPLKHADDNEPSYNDLETSLDDPQIETVETDDVTKVQKEGEARDSEDRTKRSSAQEWDKSSKTSPTNPSDRRVKTGDTILNIRGAVRDAIGDAGAAPGPRASSRLDTFVIRPAQTHTRPHYEPPRAQPSISQPPKLERELLVEAHARARIACDLQNVTNIRWYKDNELLALGGGGGGEAAWAEGEGRWAVLGRASRADAGAWRCTATARGGDTVSGKPTRLLIYEATRAVYLAVDGRRLDAGNTWVPVRDKTELEVRCVAEGGVPPPELSWRLLTPEPDHLDHRPYLRVQTTNYSIEGVSVSHAVVTAARELHNATLRCEARQRTPSSGPPHAPPSTGPAHALPKQRGPTTVPTPTSMHVLSAKLEIHVTYPPSFVISRWPGFGVALGAGGAAALRCDVDANPPARAWWLRDDAPPTSSPSPEEGLSEAEGARGSATLRWAALRGHHAGWYRCRASWLDSEYSSIGYYLNVISPEEGAETSTPAPEPEEEMDHQKVEVPLGGNVQLHCPKGSVGCWWRRVVGNTSDHWAPAGSHHAHGVLGIKDALYQEGGEYRCVGARAPELTRLRELKRVTLKVTGGATARAVSAAWAGGAWRLECGACGRGVRVAWVLAGAAAGAAAGEAAGEAAGAAAGEAAGRAARVSPAALRPDPPGPAPHCWRAVTLVADHGEVWCVATVGAQGAVAVFPPRSLPAPQPSPAPARHTVRALHNTAAARPLPTAPLPTTLLILTYVALHRNN